MPGDARTALGRLHFRKAGFQHGTLKRLLVDRDTKKGKGAAKFGSQVSAQPLVAGEMVGMVLELACPFVEV